jgi:hypothetical protein
MSSTTGSNGRLGNQIIRNLALSFIAEKNDLYVEYYNYDLISRLGIPLFVGSKKHPRTMELTDDNYMSILSEEKIDYNLNPNRCFFQTQEITDAIYKYLRSDEIRHSIVDKNPYRDRYGNNNDAFVHLRLTDASQHNPGISYYLKTLSLLSFDTLYIASDDPYHPMVKAIQSMYPKNELILADEITTIQFASTCKYQVLSHGTFSGTIGYLGYSSDIYYLNKSYSWAPLEVFLNKGWNPVEDSSF